jgi:hypothetical protein
MDIKRPKFMDFPFVKWGGILILGMISFVSFATKASMIVFMVSSLGCILLLSFAWADYREAHPAKKNPKVRKAILIGIGIFLLAVVGFLAWALYRSPEKIYITTAPFGAEVDVPKLSNDEWFDTTLWVKGGDFLQCSLVQDTPVQPYQIKMKDQVLDSGLNDADNFVIMVDLSKVPSTTQEKILIRVRSDAAADRLKVRVIIQNKTHIMPAEKGLQSFPKEQ